MNLAAWYLQIKQAHIALVGLSGTLFALRGVAVLLRARWPMRMPVRVASVLVDTLLLSAGATMWWLLRLDPLQQRWLGAKLLLLVVYVVLGSFALKRARHRATRAAFLLASLLVFATMIRIALTHDALAGWRLP
jgi:uncharacterized membrane protein SirB2